MLKAGLEALARLQLEGYHASPEAAQQAPSEQAAAEQPGSAQDGSGEQGPLPLHELPSDVLGKIIMVRGGGEGRRWRGGAAWES